VVRETGLAEGATAPESLRHPDRAGLIGTLESGHVFQARPTEGVTPDVIRGKALRFRDRGGDANGNRVTGRSVVPPGDRRPE
jgi:hypothetical protein